jgi:hypothetical protein
MDNSEKQATQTNKKTTTQYVLDTTNFMFHYFYVVYPDCNVLHCAVLLIGLPPVYDWVRVAHIFSFLYYVVFCVLCLSSSCAQCCLFMIAPSVFCNIDNIKVVKHEMSITALDGTKRYNVASQNIAVKL